MSDRYEYPSAVDGPGRGYDSAYYYIPGNLRAKVHLVELFDGRFTGKTLCGRPSRDLEEGRSGREVCERCASAADVIDQAR